MTTSTLPTHEGTRQVKAQKRTKYQVTHRPVRRTEVQCIEKGRTGGRCIACGRDVKTARAHRPNIHGCLGWVEHYADGSVRIAPPSLT